MRLRSSYLLLLAACNRLLGLSDVAQHDAAFYDAAIDAPFGCPGVGAAPSFDHGKLIQVLAQPCVGYSLDDTGMHALATCNGMISEGGTDGSPLQPAPGFEALGLASYTRARLGPDGLHATTIRRSSNPDPTVIHEEVLMFTRDAAAWTVAATLASSVPAATYRYVSQPSGGPNAHVLVDFDGLHIHEFVATGTGWEDRSTFTFPDYVSNSIEMSGDGLSAWWNRGSVFYANRASVDDAFVEVGTVPGTDSLGEAFISSGCGYIYFEALARIWRAPRK